MPVDTIPARFFAQGATRPEEAAYFVREPAGWRPTTWQAYNAQVRVVGRALITLGVQPGERVCILGFNRPEWTITDIAAMAIGAVPAGIYITCSPEEVAYIVDHAEARVVLVEDTGQWQKIEAMRDRLPHLQHVITMQGADPVDDPMVLDWASFLAKAADTPDEAVDERMAALKLDDVATLIYTSGTTGPPKAVMLTHDNLAWTAKQSQSIIDPRPGDSMLSYLPLSHIAEQVFTIQGPCTFGIAVYFAEAWDKVPDNLQEVQPTHVLGVPRVWEKLYAKVSARLDEVTGLRARLVAWARGVATRANALKNRGEQPSGLLALQYRLANRLVLSKVKHALGLSRAKACVTGAAPIAPEILEFLASLDVMIYEVYGQSETCGPTTFNGIGNTRFGTVGPPYPGVQVRIADDGEILVKGRNVFAGYLKDEAATARVMQDGWLCSGDLGAFDQDGFLTITGRKKEIIITAGGKNIAPKNIEAALKNLDLVSQAVVIGDRRKFLSALLTLDPDAAKRFAASRDLPQDGLHQHADLLAALQSGVDEVNKLFARVENVRKFTVLPEDFSVDGGELTATMKIKRRVVNDKYADAIEAMYAEADQSVA